MPYILRYFTLTNKNTDIIDPVMIAHGGKSLEEHKTEPEVRFNILYGNYHYVVLQQVAHPFTGGQKSLLKDGLEINEFIKQTKTIPVTYLTWSEKNKLENQQQMTDAYLELTKQVNAVLCPVGIIWQEFIKQYPQINIYDQDGEHANEIGSYLVACVFYVTLLNESPLGLPVRIENNNQLVLQIAQPIATNIQKLVWSYFKSCYDKN